MLCLGGLVAGLSLLEAPVKFPAPSIARAIGLDVGQHVFWALNRVELGLSAGGLGLLLLNQPTTAVCWTTGGPGAILLVQILWLLPVLRTQAVALIAGEIEHAFEDVHLGSVFLDGMKILALAFIGWWVGP